MLLNFWQNWRRSWQHKMHRPWIRALVWFEFWLIDHGFLRELYNTPEQVVPGYWRSNQPSPGRIKRLAAQGFKTIVSLRGRGPDGVYLLETEAASAAGLQLLHHPFKSKRPPSPALVLALLDTFESVETPVLIHCKSGADRTGLAAALLLLDQTPPQLAAAASQLSAKYLHSRTARTGILDAFVAAYGAAYARSGIGLRDWVQSEYDPLQLQASFKPSLGSRVLMDWILRRE